MTRDARWYMAHDRGGIVQGVEAERDRLALEINGRQRLRHADTAERMKRLGLPFADRYASMPPPYLRPEELHSSSWPTDADADRWEREQRGRARRRRLTEDEREELASLDDADLARRVR